MHVQRMLKMSSRLYTGGNFKQNIWKKVKKNWGPSIMILLINDLVPTYFRLKYINIMRSLLERLTPLLYIRKMLTNREMVNFEKWDFLQFFSLYFYYTCKLCHYRSTKKPIGYMFCFIVNNA